MFSSALLEKITGSCGTSAAARRRLCGSQCLRSAGRQRPLRLKRQRIDLLYFTRKRQTESRREVSPQRLIHYRNTWYLDAWCHLRNELRSFAVDAIHRTEILDTPTRDIDDATLDHVLGSGYGIFAGAEVRWARLRFSAERSR